MFGRFEIKTKQDLENATLKRSGETTKYWTVERRTVRIEHIPNKGYIDIRSSMPSKGGGITEFSIQIGKNDFKYILYAMLIASPQIFILQFINFGKSIKNFISAKSFVEKDFDGKLREESIYDDLNNKLDQNIKSNIILFDVLELATKKPSSAKKVIS